MMILLLISSFTHTLRALNHLCISIFLFYGIRAHRISPGGVGGYDHTPWKGEPQIHRNLCFPKVATWFVVLSRVPIRMRLLIHYSKLGFITQFWWVCLFIEMFVIFLGQLGIRLSGKDKAGTDHPPPFVPLFPKPQVAQVTPGAEKRFPQFTHDVIG